MRKNFGFYIVVKVDGSASRQLGRYCSPRLLQLTGGGGECVQPTSRMGYAYALCCLRYTQAMSRGMLQESIEADNKSMIQYLNVEGFGCVRLKELRL